MSENNRNSIKKQTKKKVNKLRLTFFIILLAAFVIGGGTMGFIYAIIKTVPPIDPAKVTAYLNENSVILNQNGDLIEQVDAKEFRTIVEIDEISEYMKKAIIAIEDERFYTHHGIDPKGLLRAAVTDIKELSFAQGASTITQQLARNIYLDKDKKLKRKIKEMYIAIQLDNELTKNQILKAYLNTIFLGQRSYGVQAAAQTYFAKDAKDLTLAESALLAGITKSPSYYSPYYNISPSKFDSQTDLVVGEKNPHQIRYVNIGGIDYVPIFNEKAVDRQRIILKKMYDLGWVTKEEYDEALNVDMRMALKIDSKNNKNITTSYLNDFVKKSVIADLIEKYGYTKTEATQELLTGGFKIYSTMDINIQNKLESAYNNFGTILAGDAKNIKGAKLVKRTLDSKNNITDSSRNIVFYKKENLLTDKNELIIEKGTYKINSDGSISIKNKKLNYYNSDVKDYYTIDSQKNLVTHPVGYLYPKSCYTSDKENKQLIINKAFLVENSNFYSIDSNENLLINGKYFNNNSMGIIQPQSAFVVMDYDGHIKALVGGRNIKGSNLLNRALSPRQPGSSLKPLSVYLPALDNGFTAASVIDDVPNYDSRGNLWPRNWYGRYNTAQRNDLTDDYKGLVTLRKSVEYSINVSSVKFLEKIGLSTSVQYLTKLGIIDAENPSSDSFRTKDEAISMGSSNFDENYSALALGGMTKGISPLRMTAGFAAIANKGIYSKPIAYTKVIDRDGNVILENKPVQRPVVSPQVAYIMTDILESTVTDGIAKQAQMYSNNSKIPVAGKTGTTQNKSDVWFVGYTPYYIAGTWIGNDSQSIKLDNGSKYASILWSTIMRDIHSSLPAKTFEPVNGIVTRTIDITSGKLATELSKRDPRGNTVRSEIFVTGTEPETYDDVHVEAIIDITTNKLATQYCPVELQESRVFIKRPIPYNPAENQNYAPADFKYEVPTDTCDAHTAPESLWDSFFNNNNNNNSNDNTIDNSNNNNDDNTNINGNIYDNNYNNNNYYFNESNNNNVPNNNDSNNVVVPDNTTNE